MNETPEDIAPTKCSRTFVKLAILYSLCGVLFLWICFAICIDGPALPILNYIICGLFTILVALVFGVFRRSRRKAALAYLCLCIPVLYWWISIAPRNDRNWSNEYIKLAHVEISGDKLVVHNLRNFDYRSAVDVTPRWETGYYDLSTLNGLDLFVSYFGSEYIAHTILSWQFRDGKHLAISIETRRELDETYSPLKGLFRQFELYYVVADERDLISLRTNHRGEDVYLYRLSTTAETARKVLLSYLKRVNELNAKPEWYNSLTQNCTNTMIFHASQVALENPWSWKILLNGYLDQLAYERGSINTSVPFVELRERSYISKRAKLVNDLKIFSSEIRRDLPLRPK